MTFYFCYIYKQVTILITFPCTCTPLPYRTVNCAWSPCQQLHFEKTDISVIYAPKAWVFIWFIGKCVTYPSPRILCTRRCPAFPWSAACMSAECDKFQSKVRTPSWAENCVLFASLDNIGGKGYQHIMRRERREKGVGTDMFPYTWPQFVRVVR